MLFCINTGAPISCTGNQTLKRIVQLAGRKSIPMIESERDFLFGYTMIRSKCMIELILPTPESLRDILILMDVVDVDIPSLLGLDVLDFKNLIVDKITEHLCSRIIIC